MRPSTIKPRIASNPFLLLFFFLGLGSGAFVRVDAQIVDDSTTILFQADTVDSTYEQEKRQQSAFYDQTTPLGMLFVGLINIYQVVFSRQEGSSSCQFRPSCSHFATQAIKKQGIIEGTLMTGDRLLRCNPWAHKHHPRWQDNRHLSDPMEDHAL